MPDKNYQLAVSTTANTSGLDSASKGFAQLQKQLAEPVKLSVNPPDVTEAVRVVDSLRTKLAEPIKGLSFSPGTAEIEKAVDRFRASLKAAGNDVDAIKKKLATDLGPINGPAVKPRFAPNEQAVRDTEAGIIRGVRRQTSAAAQQDSAAAIEAEARRRLFGDGPSPYTANSGSAFDTAQAFRITPKAQPKPGGFDASKDDWVQSMLKADEASRLRLLNQAGGGGEVARRRRLAAASAGGGNGGGEGGGGADNILGGALKVEDKVGLGAGAKLIGPVGLAAAGVVTVAKLAGELGTAMKGYKESIEKGASKNDALILTIGETAKKIPFIGDIFQGLDDLGAELNGDAAKGRRRAESDQKAADQKKIADRMQAERDRGREATRSLDSQVAAGITADRLRGAAAIEDNGATAARVQAQSDFAATSQSLKQQLEDLNRNQNSNDPSKKLDQYSFAKAQGDIKALQTEAQRKLTDDLAEADKKELQARKQQEDDVFAVRQKYLMAEGATVQAQLEAVDHAAQRAIEDAGQRVADVARKYGTDSDEYRKALQDFKNRQTTIQQDQAVSHQDLARQANNDARGALVVGYQQRAAFGDIGSAETAARIIIEQQMAERKRQLQGLIASNTLDAGNLKRVKQQLADLDQARGQQIAQAKQEIEEVERARQGGVLSTLAGMRSEQLRAEAKRTGNGDLNVEAAQIDTFEQFKQKYDQLHAIDIDPKATKAEKQSAEFMLKALPAEFADAIKEAGFAQIGSRQIADATYAQAQDAGGISGYGMAIREDSLAAGMSDAAKTAKNTEKLVNLFQKLLEGQSADIALPIFGS